MLHTPICSHPRFILNPAAVVFVNRPGSSVLVNLGARQVPFSTRGRVSMDRLRSLYSPRRFPLSVDNLSSYFAYDLVTSESVPLFIPVACGKCSNCVMSRRFSFVERCRHECQCHDSLPFFFTLTYDREHLPHQNYVIDKYDPYTEVHSTEWHSVSTLSVRDTQLFFKRLRQRLKRDFDGSYDRPIRYSICGEYGKKGRPHYHCILWGLPCSDIVSFLNIRSLICKSWDFGDVRRFRQIDSVDDKCFKYTCKYMLKPPRSIHSYQKRCFLHSSNGSSDGSGGIGSSHVKEVESFLRRSLSYKAQYLDRFSGRTVDVVFNSWSLSKLFPSFLRQVPVSVRNAFLEYEYYKVDNPFDRQFDDLIRPISKYVFVPDFDNVVLTKIHYHSLDECRMIISSFLVKNNLYSSEDIDFYFSKCFNRAVRRDEFLYTLFSFSRPVDLFGRSYTASLDIQRSQSLEVL